MPLFTTRNGEELQGINFRIMKIIYILRDIFNDLF